MEPLFVRLGKMIRSLVTQGKVDRFVLSLVRRMEPLIRSLEKGIYPLSSASSLDAPVIASTIANAIGRPVTDVVFVSASCPLPKPDWMTAENHRILCRKTDFRENIGQTLALALRSAFADGDGDLPFGNLGAGLVTDVHESLSQTRVVAIGACLYFFSRVAATVDRDALMRLTALMELLPKAVPLGEKKDADGVWLVLCA